MGRNEKKVLGPIATDPTAWPPIRRRNDQDQKALERLLKEELTSYWNAITREDGVTEGDYANWEKRSRSLALARAKQKKMGLLQQFVANSTGPDGKPLGDKIARFIREKGEKHVKALKDYLYEAQANPQLQKRTEAVWEADRAKAILDRVYGRYPDNYKLRTDLIVAAARSGLGQEEIRDWKKNRACPADPWPIGVDLLAFSTDDPQKDDLAEWVSKVAKKKRSRKA